MQLNLKLSVKDSIKSNPNPNFNATTPTRRPTPQCNVVENQLSNNRKLNNLSICRSSIPDHQNKVGTNK